MSPEPKIQVPDTTAYHRGEYGGGWLDHDRSIAGHVRRFAVSLADVCALASYNCV